MTEDPGPRTRVQTTLDQEDLGQQNFGHEFCAKRLRNVISHMHTSASTCTQGDHDIHDASRQPSKRKMHALPQVLIPEPNPPCITICTILFLSLGNPIYYVLYAMQCFCLLSCNRRSMTTGPETFVKRLMTRSCRCRNFSSYLRLPSSEALRQGQFRAMLSLQS